MTAARTRLTRSARPRLAALLDGRVVGQVYQAGNGRLAFQYDDEWRTDPSSYPLSLSMPLAATEHGDQAIRAYLWGLLPDNPSVLEWWAKRYGVSPHRVVDLLTHVGEDCAGAVQFAHPDRVAHLIGPATISDERNSISWITDAELGQRLRDLRLNPAAGRAAGDTGQFSLAGAQPKTALYQDPSGRWGIPEGRVPTNWILKPPTLGLDDLAYNEHFCLLLARELGFPAAASTVHTFGDEIAIAVERFDRTRRDRVLVRIHQEDMCQALGVRPTRKYESDGGPGIADIAELLLQHSTSPEEDFLQFVDAIAFNWLIAATDGHAKNYSILHAGGPQLRLAPLYDVITILPYPQLTRGKDAVAMSLGGERLIAAITGVHWHKLARKLGLPGEALVGRVASLASRIPEAVERLRLGAAGDDHTREIVARIGDSVIQHCRACAKRLSA